MLHTFALIAAERHWDLQAAHCPPSCSKGIVTSQLRTTAMNNERQNDVAWRCNEMWSGFPGFPIMMHQGIILCCALVHLVWLHALSNPLLPKHSIVSMLKYVDICWHMLTYADMNTTQSLIGSLDELSSLEHDATMECREKVAHRRTTWLASRLISLSSAWLCRHLMSSASFGISSYHPVYI